MKIRTEKTRSDNQARRQKISDARDKIYKDGYVVNGTAIEDILKDESLVPTHVSQITVNIFSLT